jgi:predicted anti-sigma-YlaC factor YlaD
MLNCKKAAALMSQGMDRELGLSQRMSLRFHLMMCGGCRNFNRQIAFLRQGCRKFPQQGS